MGLNPIDHLDDAVNSIDDVLTSFSSRQELRRKLANEEFSSEDVQQQLEALEQALAVLEELREKAETDVGQQLISETEESLKLIWAVLDKDSV